MGDPGSSQGGLEVDAFAALAADHATALYRFARSLGADPAAAEDLVQDAFLRAFQRRDQHRGGNVGAWLRRILHNIAVDRARAGSSREIPVETVEQRWSEDSYTVDAATVVERAELREELEDGLVRLPFIYRTAVVLHDVEGWPVRDIAEALGVGLPAAKQRLRRGRMMLVTALATGAERRAAVEGVPMACWNARLMVSDYLDGQLDVADRSRVEAHLGECPTCPPLYAALVGVQARLWRLRDPDSVIRPGLAKRIATRLQQAATRPPDGTESTEQGSAGGEVPATASEHPAQWKFGYPIYHAETRGAWRAWLAAHHGSARGVWLASWKRQTGRPAVPYAEAVEEALCFGWIDSTVNTLDEERSLQLMTPRRPRSGWTRLNRERVARLEAEGRMTPAGRHAVEVAQHNGWWRMYDAVEDLVEPADLAAALDAVPQAREHWDAFPPSARKQMLWSVITAAKPATRARRIEAIVTDAERGRRVGE